MGKKGGQREFADEVEASKDEDHSTKFVSHKQTLQKEAREADKGRNKTQKGGNDSEEEKGAKE